MHTFQADFDRIALLSEEGWDHNEQYHRYLLSHVPKRCIAALDVGCGTGSFTRHLARRAECVLALDLSPRMIDVAKQRSTRYPNIQFEVADATEYELGEEQFDCVASIAMLHHVDAGEMLWKMGQWLKAGGTLAILDLFEPQGPGDFFRGVVAAPVAMVLRLVKTGRLRISHKAHEAWAAHGRHETYSTVPTLRRICEQVLPGAQVKQHMLWRYSIIWKKPA